jgi:hypothetical protein
MSALPRRSSHRESKIVPRERQRIEEVAKLSNAIGTADAMIGMISSCSTCGDVRDVLGRVIHFAGILKLEAEGTPTTCTADGVIEPTEECDPPAEPDGCSVGTLGGLR